MFCPVRAADGVSGVGNGRAEDSAGCGPVRPNGARRGRSMPIRARERNARQRRMRWSTTGRWPGSSREGRGRSGKWPGGRRLRSVDLVDFHGSILASPHICRERGEVTLGVARNALYWNRRVIFAVTLFLRAEHDDDGPVPGQPGLGHGQSFLIQRTKTASVGRGMALSATRRGMRKAEGSADPRALTSSTRSPR